MRPRFMRKTSADAGSRSTSRHAAGRFLSFVFRKNETSDLTEQTADLAEPLTEKWIDQIKALADECKDIYELRDRLLEIYNSMDTDELGEVMAAALEVAELSGRSEV